MKQQIQLRRREVDETADLPAELPPLLRRLYASRGVRSAQELERSVKGMLPWQQLSGVEKAIATLAVCQSFTSHVEVTYNSGFPDLVT